MRTLFALILLLHGLIHALGFVKAFGLAPIEALKVPISRPMGVVWLLAGVLLVLSVVVMHVAPRSWWWIALPALVLSQVAIVTSWGDARFGTLPNVLLALALVPALVDASPWGLRGRFEAERDTVLAARREGRTVAEADLAAVPPLVAAHLRNAGVIGRPAVQSVMIRMRGRIRNGIDAPWMPFEATQYSRFDEPTRLFWIDARLFGLPVGGYHRFVPGEASMEIRAASLVPVASASGPEMRRAETVTMFNDMVMMAPATLIDARIVWRQIDERTVGARYTAGDQTIDAVLIFDEAGRLVDFHSDDRTMTTDGSAFVHARWSTPIDAWGMLDGRSLPVRAHALWLLESGPFPYAEFDLIEVVDNPMR